MKDDLTNIIDEAARLHAAGDLLKAALAYKNLAECDPLNVQALYGWACVAFDRGNLANAQNILKRLLAIRPDHAEAYAKLAAIYIEGGHYEPARRCCEASLKADPGCAAAFNFLAVAFLKEGEYTKAEDIARQGLSLNPDYGLLHSVLGYASYMLGRTEPALDHYQKALGLATTDARKASLLSSISSVCIGAGDKRQAEVYLGKAIERQPDLASAHYALSQIHDYAKQDPHIRTMMDLLERATDRPDDAAYLHFGLANACEKTGDYDAAFAHMAEGNAIRRARIAYSMEETDAFFQKIKSMYPAGFGTRALPVGDVDFRPVFIVGMPRSGTTLAEQVLSSHPDVAAADETFFLEMVQRQSGLMSWNDIADVPDNVLRDMRRRYLGLLRQYAPDAKYITDKMPTNFRFIGLIRVLFPEAKIIHCRRDPMDTCFSIYKRLFESNLPFACDLREIAHFYRSYEDLMSFWSRRIPSFVHDVRHQELVENQEAITRRMLDFCGLSWDPACLDFHNNRRSVRTASALQVTKPIFRESAGGWREYGQHLKPLAEALASTS